MNFVTAAFLVGIGALAGIIATLVGGAAVVTYTVLLVSGVLARPYWF